VSEAELRDRLDEAHERAIAAAERLRHRDDPRRQLHAYALFEESLRVAGLAAALADEERLQNALENAAAAAAQTFALRGTLPALRQDLDADLSTTNPWTWLQGVYAALASGRADAEEELVVLPPEALSSEQATASPGLEGLAAALRAALAGDEAAARRALERVPADEPYYAAQAAALAAILDGREPDLGAVAAASDEAWSAPGLRDEPERHLRLPALGLRALADRGAARG
jgi:hypothetical protein